MTVGLDLSDKNATFVRVDRRGNVVEEGKVELKAAALTKQFGGPPVRIALEAGCHSPWVSRLLATLGHEVIVANPRQLALIAKSTRKSDRMDALTLARLARIDPELLRPIVHRSEQAQADLALLRSRDELIRTRTALINHVRGSVKAMGSRLPGCSAQAFGKKASTSVPANLRPALGPVFATIGLVTAQIKAMDKQICRLIKERYPVAGALQRQVKGVGPITALAFVLIVDDPARFQRSRDIGAYLGLTRKRRDSGESEPALHITKAGDPFLRRLLVQCVHYILGHPSADSTLRRRGLALAERLGRKRAVIAIARKLAVLLHSLWTTGEVYEPLRDWPALTA